MPTQINFIAVILATISTFIIGGLWYGPLFSRAWMRENGFTNKDLAKRNMIKVFGVSLVLGFISSLLLAMFIGKDTEIVFAVLASISVGLGWVSLSFGTTYIFENRSLKLFLINAGHHTVTFGVMGLIIGLL